MTWYNIIGWLIMFYITLVTCVSSQPGNGWRNFNYSIYGWALIILGVVLLSIP
jgi:hypothetical protein